MPENSRGLVPGTYRLTAYPEGALWADDPNVKQRLATGEEARITDKQTVRIQVRTQTMP